MLKQIAETTGAMYQPLGQQAAGTGDDLHAGSGEIYGGTNFASRRQQVFIERFQWPLAVGLFCLVLEPLIGIRRNKTRDEARRRPRVPALAAAWNRMARPAAAIALLGRGRFFFFFRAGFPSARRSRRFKKVSSPKPNRNTGRPRRKIRTSRCCSSNHGHGGLQIRCLRPGPPNLSPRR